MRSDLADDVELLLVVVSEGADVGVIVRRAGMRAGAATGGEGPVYR